MNRIKTLYDVTKELEKVLDQKITSGNREDVIDQVNHLVEKRGKYMDQVEPPFTDGEKQLGKELVGLNEKIQKQMHILFEGLKLEMRQVKKQKKSNQTYTNPYQDVQTMDGMFMDSKK